MTTVVQYFMVSLQGTAYRCVRVSGEHPDNVMFAAARECGLDISEIFTYLPDELTLWIDPNEVSYRIGEKSPIKVLFSERNREQAGEAAAIIGGMDGSMENANATFNPEAQVFLPEAVNGVANEQPSQLHQGSALMANFGHISLTPSPTSPQHSCWSASPSPTNGIQTVPYTGPTPVNSYLQKSISTPNFTAASFAATKFGSTKLKSHTKRPNRLTPNSEVGAAPGSVGCPSQTPVHMNGYSQHKTSNHRQYASPSMLRSISLSPHEQQQYSPHYQQHNGQLDIPLLLPGRSNQSQPTDFLSLHIPTAAELMAMNGVTNGGSSGPASGGSSSASSSAGVQNNDGQQGNGADAYSTGQLLMAN